MKVVCKYKNIHEITNENRKNKLIIMNKGSKNPDDYVSYEEDLVIGKEYTVYATQFIKDELIYFLYEEEVNDKCPYPYISDFFEVSDSRVSLYWKMNIEVNSKTAELIIELAYPEWVEDPLYLEELIDGSPQNEKIFKHYKELMDKEFD